MSQQDDPLLQRALQLRLYGLVARWPELRHEPWVLVLVELEEAERQHRSLERRMRSSRVGAFKPMADFEWSWPTRIDRDLIEELFNFQFLDEAANVVLVGSSGLGKSMVAQNLAHQALLKGHTVCFTSASTMLNDLAAQDGAMALQRRIRHYSSPKLLVIDEVGWLSYDHRYADLLFEIVSQRNQQRSIVLTTNRPFKEWNEIFPNAACVVALVDRLIHKAEIVQIEGESYRLKEAKERAERSAAKRKKPPGKSPPGKPLSPTVTDE